MESSPYIQFVGVLLQEDRLPFVFYPSFRFSLISVQLPFFLLFIYFYLEIRDRNLRNASFYKPFYIYILFHRNVENHFTSIDKCISIVLTITIELRMNRVLDEIQFQIYNGSRNRILKVLCSLLVVIHFSRKLVSFFFLKRIIIK